MFRDHHRSFVLVDDSRLMAMCWKLEVKGRYALKAYATPREFLDSLQEMDEKAVLLLDVDFAGLDPMNGVELAHELRARGITNPIYLYSGFSDLVAPSLLSDGIIHGIFSKDVSPKELLESLDRQN
jgi:FixJ family two-component response regulator